VADGDAIAPQLNGSPPTALRLVVATATARPSTRRSPPRARGRRTACDRGAELNGLDAALVDVVVDKGPTRRPRLSGFDGTGLAALLREGGSTGSRSPGWPPTMRAATAPTPSADSPSRSTISASRHRSRDSAALEVRARRRRI
jgi:hypothetical protein